MPLAPGTRLGPYEVTAQIGVGGMGEVYQATDTKLKRQVAIKVLPQTVAGDKDRLARFQREAEVLASLNHTHIAQIHGLEDADAGKALVMELKKYAHRPGRSWHPSRPRLGFPEHGRPLRASSSRLLGNTTVGSFSTGMARR